MPAPQVDLATDEGRRTAIEKAEACGIDLLINNAGAGLFGPVTNAEAAVHRRVVEINLFGAMNGASAVLPVFLRQRFGEVSF